MRKEGMRKANIYNAFKKCSFKGEIRHMTIDRGGMSRKER